MLWRFKLVNCLLLLFGVCKVSYCLYEDQIGKFDWKQKFVGKLKFSHFDSIANVKRIIVATDENVIAALNLKSGEVLWRQILERSDPGIVQLMNVDSYVVTVTGHSATLVRGWNPAGGFLEWEWTLPSTLSDNHQVMWFMHHEQLYRVIILGSAHVDVSSYDVMSGSLSSARQIPVPWMSEDSQCRVVGQYLACLVKEGILYSINLSAKELVTQSKPLLDLFPASETITTPLSLEDVGGSLPAVAIIAGGTKQLVTITPSGPVATLSPCPAGTQLVTVSYERSNILLQIRLVEGWLELAGTVLETGEQVTDLEGKSKYPSDLGEPSLSSAVCSPRKDKTPGCRIMLSTEDHGIALMLHPGKLVWLREEALASIVAVEMLDLPLSDADSAIEKEFDHKESGFVGMFIHRLTSQVIQLYSLVTCVLGLGQAPSPFQRAGLERDEFSLHKMIVVATEAGKLFGINNRNGEIVWQHRLLDVESFSGDVADKKQMLLFVQRSTRHFPYPAQCALLARHKVSGEGVLFVFNPFTGNGIGENGGRIVLGYRVKQTLLLHQVDREFMRGVLLLDDADNLHVYPPGASEVVASVASTTYMFAADRATGVLTGYSLAFSTEESLVASRVWEVKLTQAITAVVGKNPQERVHSQGRVLGDRSVLYKYNNPNLVAVVTQGEDPVHKYLLNIYLVDVVSGAVVFSVCHKKAHHPVHVVHSENWLVYSYFSEKSRRTEVASLELYEGKTQSNTTAFSSIHAPLQPIVDRQAYILPSMVDAMRETITEKGITSKHILVALPSGSILEMPWMYVDPRRPITVTPEMREEGVIPYMPELPIPSDHIINYNRSVLRVTGMHTAPSGLESTSLVLVYGLDLFYTRVAPSKTFDVLKEDFDHVLITAVLLGLILASYGSKKLASKKALKQAWK